MNPAFDAVIGNRPRLFVINKYDLIEPDDAKLWKRYFQMAKYNFVFADSAHKTDALAVKNGLKETASVISERYRKKGVEKTIRAMVIGIPNVGKSTLINSLTAEKKTVTGDRPGVTRGKQWVAIDKYIDLLDSPGVLYPDFKDQEKATRLALIGSIKDDVLDKCELALLGIKILCKLAPNKLATRYNISDINAHNPLGILEEITLLRGYRLKGDTPDIERAASAFINEFRKGQIGKFVLDEIPLL
jgi:ribosome biogenesis GTPase A